jgi:YD repeat-containing protein
MTDPQGGVTSYVYYTLNRLSTLTPPAAFTSDSFGFTYDALSRGTQMTRPNGVATNYTYNNLSQLLSVLHQVGTSTIDGATYTVVPTGNRTDPRYYPAPSVATEISNQTIICICVRPYA